MELHQMAEAFLLPLDSCRWHESDVPLASRGVRFSWVRDFAAKLDTTIQNMWAAYERAFQSEYEASCYFPEANPCAIGRPAYPSEPLTTRQFVEMFAVPLTQTFQVPLYARVPAEHRGTPSVFISHTWDSMMFRGTHGSLDIIDDDYSDAFAWIDFVCYNQHRTECVARDMRDIIAAIGTVAFVLTTEPFFSRSWCLWEIACAHRAGCNMKYLDQTARIQTKYWGSEATLYPPAFRSISEAAAVKESDRTEILQAMISTFGSIQEADDYLRGVLPKLGHTPLPVPFPSPISPNAE